MSRPWRAVVGAIGVFNLLIGLAFLILPAEMALGFYVTPLGIQGMATLRADFAAFFCVGGGAALLAAARSVHAPLLVPIALLGVALVGRLVSLIADGAASTAFAPMLAEAVMITLLALARRSMPA